jgi:hypothetical protein
MSARDPGNAYLRKLRQAKDRLHTGALVVVMLRVMAGCGGIVIMFMIVLADLVTDVMHDRMQIGNADPHTQEGE